MQYVLGIDAGGTKTHGLVADAEGHILGFGKSGPGNYESIGVPAAQKSNHTAAKGAADSAGIPLSEIQVGCLGLAGADFPEDYVMLHEAMLEMKLAREIFVKNDTMVAFRAGSRRGYGAVVIMGTGTNAAGRSPDGREVQIGGEGYLYGDWGGGIQIGQAFVHYAVRSLQKRIPETMLAEMLLKEFDAPDLQGFLLKLYHKEIPWQMIASKAPLVFEAAYEGDWAAREIVIHAGREAGLAATGAIRSLGMESLECDAVMAGSVFKGKGPLLLDTVRQTLHTWCPLAEVVVARYAPAVGAVLLALERLGVQVTDEIYHNIEQTLPAELIPSPEMRIE